jgi:hypothetical protein
MAHAPSPRLVALALTAVLLCSSLLAAGWADPSAIDAVVPTPHGTSAAPRAPPPQARHPTVGLPAPGPLANANHYWDGSVYNGATVDATQVSVVETVPDDHPDATNFYYVIMSVWDSANSYDQIGFANDYGTWGLVYSWTNSCANAYYYTADAMALVPGQSYIFNMAIESGGNVLFSAQNVSGHAQLWSLLAPTGGTYFSVQEFYSPCSGDYDYTDYEESYDSTQNVPTYDWFFTNNTMNGNNEVNWTSFAAGTYPAGIVVLNSRTNVTIENEPFYGGFVPNNATVESGTSVLYAALDVWPLAPAGTLTLAVASAPVGWTVTLTPGSGVPTFSALATISLGAGGGVGTQYLQVTATNSNALYTRFMLEVKLVAHVTAGAITASPASVDVGQTVNFTETPSSGTGGYAYAWSHLPTGCASRDLSTLACVPAAAGTFDVVVNVTDSAGYWAISAAFPYTVHSDPAATLPVATPATVDVGQTANWTTSTSGGAGGNTLTWLGLPNGCASANALAISCTPSGLSSNVTFSVYVTVRDSNGFTATSPVATFVVDADPTVSPPTESAAAADPHQIVLLSEAVTGGAGGYAFHWWGLPLGCPSVDLPLLSCTAPIVSANESLSISVSVVDANGFNATSSAVVLTLHPPLAFAPTAAPLRGNAPLTVAFAAHMTGGSGVYFFSWTLGDGGTGATGGFLHTYPQPGNYTVALVVTDSLGVRLFSNLTVVVLAPLASVALLPTSASIQTGGTSSFTASILCTNGGCPTGTVYTWTLSSSLGTLSSTSGSSTTFSAGSAGGTLVLTVSAMLNGITRTANATITITKPSALAGILGLPGYDGVLLLVLVAAVALAVIMAIAMRRRKRSGRAPAPAAPPAGGEPPTYAPAPPGGTTVIYLPPESPPPPPPPSG